MLPRLSSDCTGPLPERSSQVVDGGASTHQLPSSWRGAPIRPCGCPSVLRGVHAHCTAHQAHNDERLYDMPTNPNTRLTETQLNIPVADKASSLQGVVQALAVRAWARDQVAFAGAEIQAR